MEEHWTEIESENSTNDEAEELENSVDTPMMLSAGAPYYYDYYGEMEIEQHNTIIDNQETIIQNGYVISMLIAIVLVVSIFRNIWKR